MVNLFDFMNASVLKLSTKCAGDENAKTRLGLLYINILCTPKISLFVYDLEYNLTISFIHSHKWFWELRNKK